MASISLVEISDHIRAHIAGNPAPSADPAAKSCAPLAAGLAFQAEAATGAEAPDRKDRHGVAVDDSRPATGHQSPSPYGSGLATVADPESDPRPNFAGDGAAANGNQRVPVDTAAAVAYWYERDPDLHPAEVALKVGRSERTVRRYWPPGRQQPASGHR